MIRIFISKLLALVIRMVLSKNYGNIVYMQIFENLHQVSLLGLNYGFGGNIQHSGEKYVIKYISRHYEFNNERFTIFDVGANHGQYSLEVLKEFKSKNLGLYCFEPSIENFQILQKSINAEGVLLENIGFGSKVETRKLFNAGQPNSQSSIIRRDFMKDSTFEQVQLSTIDKYCHSHNIEKIDFLKLDVEGTEFEVLNGARKYIDTGKIKFIQFEFGGCNIDSRTFFRDFYDLLTPKYRLFRILRNGLQEIQSYHWRLEVFGTTNFFAVLK